MDISVVIPLYNEDESLPELYDWIERVMSANNFSFEVIFVSSSAVTTANRPHSIVVSRKLRATWLSRWMPTCRTRPTRFPSSTR